MVRRTGRTRRARRICDRRVLLAIIWPSDNRPARIGGSTILVATRDLARLANPVGGQRSHRAHTAEPQIGLKEEPLLIFGTGIAVPLLERDCCQRMSGVRRLWAASPFLSFERSHREYDCAAANLRATTQQRNRGEMACQARRPFATLQGGTR